MVSEPSRPDIEAARRGGDWAQRIAGEGIPADSDLAQSRYWRGVYLEILAMEESVLDRIRELQTKQSATVRAEVELTNVPVVAAQVERFRQRLGYWDARLAELNGAVGKRGPDPPS